MASVAGDISVRVGADISALRQGMRDGSRAVQDFEGRTAQMAANVVKSGAIVATAIVGITTSILGMAKAAADSAAEIKILSDTAGVGTTEFQRMAAAAESVGIEQDKLSDIFKDVNDKFGDFMETGAGPLADFFENIAPQIGVTAQEFASLSGPDALQLYVDSLEKANVSQQQMTFYMEALAGDATTLIPLLANSGAEMRRLGDEAQAAGRVLSEQMIDNAVELKEELDELAGIMRTRATAAVLEHKDELLLLIAFITDTVLPALASMVDVLATVAEGWRAIGQAASDAIGPLARALSLSGEQGPGAQTSPENQNQIQSDLDITNGMGGDDPSGTGLGYIDENGNYVEYGTGAATPEIPGITRGAKVYGGRGQASGPTADDILEAQVEAHQAASAAVEEEAERHQSALSDITRAGLEEREEMEKLSLDAKLQYTASALGDLGALMQTESKKAFKIGQAASVAEATITGYQAAVNAWQKGMSVGGPWVAGAYAAASVAKTASLISSIKNTQFSGGGGGGSVAATSAAAAPSSAASASPSLDRSITLIGETFGREQTIRAIEFTNEGIDNGSVVIR